MRSRVLAAVLGVFFALQPAVRAGACPVRSLFAGIGGSACCCAAQRAERTPERPSCCARPATETPPGAPTVRGAGCGCEVRAPAPGDALPRSSDPRSPNASDADSTAHWLAAGARASASTPCATVHEPPDSSSDPSSVREASRERRPPSPDSVARACARGVNGLLAVLGVALL
jgi:hypothetical protein